MVLILAIGDTCVPYGAADIHPKLKSLLKPGKIERVLCTGNISDKGTLDFLRSVSSNLTVVQGDLDDCRSYDRDIVLQIEDFRVGVCRLCIQNRYLENEGLSVPVISCNPLRADVLVLGGSRQSTHAGKGVPARKEHDVVLIYPGSASGFESDFCSFVLMDIKGDKMIVYCYSIPVHAGEDQDVRVEKFEFSK